MQYSKINLLIIIITLLPWRPLAAQNHEHIDPVHEHPENELALANLLVYLGDEQEFAYGLHLHYLRAFEDSKFGTGLGYAQIFDEHGHKAVGIIGSYTPVPHLSFMLSPGISFGGQEDPGIRFAIHLETTYEFELGHFHLGPTLGFAYSSQDYHIGLGLHMGYGF